MSANKIIYKKTKSMHKQPDFNKPQINELLFAMEQNAQKAPILELTPTNWLSQFGKTGTVETPVGTVKMGENQYNKLVKFCREKEFGMIKPTLTNPDVIIEEKTKKSAIVNERDTNLLFIKTFNIEGEKYQHFESVTVSRDKKEVVVSNHFIRQRQLLNKLQAGCVVYIATDLNASGQTFSDNTSNTDTGGLFLTTKLQLFFEKTKYFRL